MPDHRDRPIVVSAAVIERDGCFLVTRRPEGTHLAGHWEFPGGTCEDAETPERCLQRELREELDVDVMVVEEMFRTRYEYWHPDAAAASGTPPGHPNAAAALGTPPGERYLELRFFRCVLNGVPRPRQGQQMRWVPRHALSALTFPPADAEFIAQLNGGR
jgi:8-oxo-dGTP diphosphatase